MHTNVEELQLYNRAKKRWEEKKNNFNVKYNMKKHKEWCDISNKGVTNFGAPPNIFHRSAI